MSTSTKLTLAAACAFALAACQPQTAAKPAAEAPPAAPAATQSADAGCSAHVDAVWIAQKFTAEAQTLGPSCANAVALLVIRDQAGVPAFTWVGATKDLFGLSEAKDAAAMKKALADWIDQNNSSLPTSDKLPDWKETADQPKAAEFPFHPESWIDAPGYEALRKEKAPMFCFPQGMESLNCAAYRNDAVESVGLQQFPG